MARAWLWGVAVLFWGAGILCLQTMAILFIALANRIQYLFCVRRLLNNKRRDIALALQFVYIYRIHYFLREDFNLPPNGLGHRSSPAPARLRVPSARRHRGEHSTPSKWAILWRLFSGFLGPPRLGLPRVAHARRGHHPTFGQQENRAAAPSGDGGATDAATVCDVATSATL